MIETTRHDAPAPARPSGARAPVRSSYRDETKHGESGGVAVDSSGSSARDDAYGCVEWFDYEDEMKRVQRANAGRA